MQPPSPTPRSLVPVAMGLWGVGMGILTLAVATDRPLFVCALPLVMLLARVLARTAPPPTAAVRALEADRQTVGYEDAATRVVEVGHRRVALSTPRAAADEGCFVVSVPHALPLADHTWVAVEPTRIHSRHAPHDLRTQTITRVLTDGAPPHARPVLTGETVDFWLPMSESGRVTTHLPALVAWTEQVEVAFVTALVEAWTRAGLHHVTLTDGGAGCLVFQGQDDHSEVVLRYGRFVGDTPSWRGRPELRVARRTGSRRPEAEAVFIGPCTRSVDADVRAVLAR